MRTDDGAPDCAERTQHPLQFNNRCFACGRDNAHGLHLFFVPSDEGGVAAEWRTSPSWESYDGVIHGGIVSTILDEAMSKAIGRSGPPGFTCDLRVRLKHHLTTGQSITVKGWVVERRKRRVLAEASLQDSAGSELAHGWATFLTVK
jgi:acyl-coenzyme A thioesterase PaaI-like protein